MFLTGQVQFEQSFRPFLGFGFRGAMEQDEPSDGAQTQPLAGSESGSSFVQVVAQSLAGSGSSLVQDEQPAAVGAASVGASYVDVTGFDDVTPVTSQDQPLAVGSVAEAEPSAETPSLWRVVVHKWHWWL